MDLIHESTGHAREYSPLVLDIYTNCDHNCRYCTNRKRKSSLVFPGYVRAQEDFRDRLTAELAQRSIVRQVLMGMTGDPYCNAELRYEYTQFALTRLRKHQVPVAILTKGGTRAMNDLKRFMAMHCKVGASLTCERLADSLAWEPGAASPGDRIVMLKRLKAHRIRTWVSLEPVIDPVQTLALIDRTHAFVDEYQVGRLPGFREPNPIDWRWFTGEVVEKLRGYGKAFYIRKSLQCFAHGLTEVEKDPEHFALTMETATCA